MDPHARQPEPLAPEPAAESPWATRRIVSRLLARVVSERGRLGQSLDELPGRLDKVARQCSLILEMVDDVRAGRTHSVPLRALLVGAAALLYTASPADIVPDALPFLGSLDDLAVIAIATRLVRRDLERYCAAKGHDVRAYF